MPRLEPYHYAALAREIGGHADQRVKAVHQAGEHRFLLVLDAPETRVDLVLDLDPDLPRAHLDVHQPAPGAPTALAHTLRNLLAGARLVGARAVAGERALAIDLSLGGLPRTVWFEGFGRQANLYVLDEAGLVAATVRGEVARARSASVGCRFAPSPPRPATAPEPPAPDDASANIRELAQTAVAEQELTRRAKDLERWLRSTLAKAQGTVAALEAMERRAEAAPALRAKGELLRASFHLLEPGQGRVRVTDHTQDPPVEVEVELDPSRTPGEQVAECFRQAEKVERGAEEACARRPAIEATLARTERLLAELPGATSPDALAALEAEAGRPLAQPLPRAPQPPAPPWRTFVSLDGWPILVGKDARGNDQLTTRHAAPGDLFLHVRAASGSHVIVPTPRGKTVPKETLLDAAELACLYSSRATAEHNEVDYAERRHVRKPRGSPAGLVAVERCKTLSVRRDDARRARLGQRKT
jgi:predicted ribosome quality control (RQC) complex YloA/Tae2 family protein